jgi:hypothetical protein
LTHGQAELSSDQNPAFPQKIDPKVVFLHLDICRGNRHFFTALAPGVWQNTLCTR